MECLKVHFVFRFFYRACAQQHVLCKEPSQRVWLGNGISLPEVRLSQVMKHLLLLFALYRCALSKRTQGASLSTDMLMAKLNLSALERIIKDTFVLL